MEYKAPHRKRFVYKAVVGGNKWKQGNGVTSRDTFDFPENLQDEFMSQPTKRLRLEESPNKQDNILDGLMDDDFDFDDAANNEINNIEVTASQQVGNNAVMENKKTKNIFLNNINKSKLSLKLPKSAVNNYNNNNNLDEGSSLLSPLRPPLSKNIKPLLQTENSKIISQYAKPQNSLPATSNEKNINFTEKSERNTEVTKLQTEIDKFKNKLEESERKFYSKDGEIKILRETLRKQNDEDSKNKERILELQNQLATQQSEKEENLLKEVEKLQTQLQFRSKEIDDMRKKEKQNVTIQKKIPTQPPVEGFLKSPPKHTKAKNLNINKKKFVSKSFASKLSKHDSNIQSNTLLIMTDDSRINIDTISCVHDVTQTDHKTTTETFYSTLSSINQFRYQGHLYYNKFLHTLCKELTTCFESISKLSYLNPNEIIEKKDAKVLCNECSTSYKRNIYLLYILSEKCMSDKDFRKLLLKNIFDKAKKNKKTKRELGRRVGESSYFYRNAQTNILVKSMENVSMSDDQLNISKHSSDIQNDLKKIFQNLLKLPLAAEDIHVGMLSVIQSLTIGMETTEANSLTHFIQQEKLLSSFFVPTVTTKIVVKIVAILIGCIKSENLLSMLCTKSEGCPLVFIYSHLIQLGDNDEREQLLTKVVYLLSSILSSSSTSHQKNASEFLLERKCQCSSNLIECLTFVLFDEFQRLENLVYNNTGNVNSHTLLNFRQAMSLLATLCMNDKSLDVKKSGVEAQFTYLLSGAVRLYRTFPSITDAEVMALEDLLEVD